MAGVDEKHESMGESLDRRILVICLCLMYFFVLVLQHGMRCGQLQGKQRKSMFLEALLYIQFSTTIAIVSSVVLLEAGFAMVTDGQCYAASVICILLFGISKTALYMIFNEHVHTLRAPHLNRMRDSVWLTCTACIVAGFAGSIFFAAVAPWAQLERKTGQCNIHLTREAIISFSTFLLAVGTYLTGMFVCMLWPALRSYKAPISTRASIYTQRRLSFLSVSRDGRLQEDDQDRKGNNIILWKNLVGWNAALLLTLINLIVYLTWDDAKRSHVCLLSCVTDVTLSMFVTNWLTKNTSKKAFYNRYSKKNAHDDSPTKSVFDRPSMRKDSWVEYMDTLGREKHASFDMSFIEARVQPGHAWPGVLPDILEEERIQAV